MPIDLLSCDVQKTVYRNQPFVLCLETIRKSYYFAMSDEKELNLWADALVSVQQRSLKRVMGHEKSTMEERRADALGNEMVGSKKRIEERENSRELSQSSSRIFSFRNLLVEIVFDDRFLLKRFPSIKS